MSQSVAVWRPPPGIAPLMAVVSLLFAAAPAVAATATSLVTLNTRPGVTQTFILIQPDQPVASVILFPGGNGVLNLSRDADGNPVIGDKSGNFLVRTRQDFAAAGFTVAVVDAPSDHQDMNGMGGPFRASGGHAQDIAAVVSYVKNQASIPVWLVGTSAGTISAASNAIRFGQNVSGLVLTSSASVVATLSLAAIQVPTFVLHHDQDECPDTPPSAASTIAAALTGAAVVSLTFLTGGLPPVTPPCDGSGSRHGYYGIESQAVAAIAAFISTTWVQEGVRLTDVTSGFPGGSVANVSAFQLRDGRWRLLLSAGGAIRSAISSDGLSLTMEAGVRVADPGACGHVRALRLDDGRVRVYCRNLDGIVSFISSDEGITLTPESDLLIPNAAVGASRLSPGGIVRTGDGQWRMYFSDEFPGGGRFPPMKIFSATSSDLLTWTVEPGVRIGAGATVSGTATHPSAIVNPDGSISVFYTRFGLNPGEPDSAVWTATSSDGLTFTSDTSTGLSPGADPDVVRVGSSLRMYYNWGNDKGGTIYSAFSASGTPAITKELAR